MPQVPPGTPPALVREPASDGSAGKLVPVPSDFSNMQTEARWATFRPGKLVLETLCCLCLQPPTSAFKLPIAIGRPLGVPLCLACYKRLQRQWWLRNFALVPMAVLVGWVVSLLPGRQIDDVGRLIILIGVAFFMVLINVVIVDLSLRPYRMRTVDKGRNIYRIAFKNPAYTALLIRRIGQADGLFQENASAT